MHAELQRKNLPQSNYDKPEEAFMETQIISIGLWTAVLLHICVIMRPLSKTLMRPVKSILVANRESTEVRGQGDIETIMIDTRGNKVTILLQDMLWIPALKRNLLSVQALTRKSHFTTFRSDGDEIALQDKSFQIRIQATGKLYYIAAKKVNSKATC